jgi:hypothetical protein
VANDGIEVGCCQCGGAEQADMLTRALGRPIKPGRLPGIVVRLFLGRHLYRMFQWTDKNGASLPFSSELR